MPNEVDMNKLREEAARRAREMQARARIPPHGRVPHRSPRGGGGGVRDPRPTDGQREGDVFKMFRKLTVIIVGTI